MTSLHTRSSQPSIPWTPDDDVLLKSNYHLHKEELQALFPTRTWGAIYQRGCKYQLIRPAPKHPFAWSKEDLAYLHASYGKVPHAEMAIRLKRKEHAITEYARRQGLTMAYDEAGKTVNTADFPTLVPLLGDNPQAYYWMGYLMADGYMHHGLGQIVLVSAEADKDQMAVYAAYLKSKVHRYEAPSPFTGLMTPHYRVSVAENVTAKKIAEKYDWRPQKTYNPPSREVLDKTLASDDAFFPFMIGFMDGDGHITEAFGARIENHSSWLTFHHLIYDRMKRMNFEGQPPKINSAGYSDLNLRKAFVSFLKSVINQHQLPVLTRKWATIQP